MRNFRIYAAVVEPSQSYVELENDKVTCKEDRTYQYWACDVREETITDASRHRGRALAVHVFDYEGAGL